ncbi:MAG: hypothetical protein M0R48_07440 [Candidatus Omnitrophica bacterium]|jgi:hypothetical protein|nr:hypothetical protein [Candidatus Omnitrophota bacterium]
MAGLIPSIIISKEQTILEHNNYFLDIKVPLGKGWFGSGIDLLIAQGYLRGLIDYLRNGKDCFLLYECPAGYEKNEKVQGELSSAQLIYSLPHRSFLLFERQGRRIYWLAEEGKSSSQLESIACSLFKPSYVTLFLLFENKQMAQELYNKVRHLTLLKNEFIVPLVSDSIKLDIGCCSAEESFNIFSNSVTKEEIVNKIKELIKKNGNEVTVNEKI